jgi:hypothetical protein
MMQMRSPMTRFARNMSVCPSNCAMQRPAGSGLSVSRFPSQLPSMWSTGEMPAETSLSTRRLSDGNESSANIPGEMKSLDER